MSVPVTEKTHVEVNKPGAFQEATIERKVEPQPAATVLPTAHTHEPAEQVDEKVLKQRKEQQKQSVSFPRPPPERFPSGVGILVRRADPSLLYQHGEGV